MRIETTTRELYQLDELGLSSRMTALDNLARREHEHFEPELIADEIVYAIANALRSPGWVTFGPGDFPGIDGFSLTEWDLDRGTIVGAGTLDVETAPNLPWAGFTEYHFDSSQRFPYAAYEDGSGAWVEVTTVHYRDMDVVREDAEHFDALHQAVYDALHDGLTAGRDAWEWQTSEECLAELAEVNEWEFTADGGLA